MQRLVLSDPKLSEVVAGKWLTRLGGRDSNPEQGLFLTWWWRATSVG